MSDRREFFRQAAALTVGLAASDADAVSAQQRAAAMPTPRASALMALFGLKYPIFSAGMGMAPESPASSPSHGSIRLSSSFAGTSRGEITPDIFRNWATAALACRSRSSGLASTICTTSACEPQMDAPSWQVLTISR